MKLIGKNKEGKSREEIEEEVKDGEKVLEKVQKKNKKERDEGSRYTALWLLIITILLSVGFWISGRGGFVALGEALEKTVVGIMSPREIIVE